MTKIKLLKNISWLFFDKVLRIFGGLFVGIWVARYLGPSDFGILNYAMAYTALFMLFVKLGLDQIVVREIVKNVKLTNYLLGTAFGLKLMGSIIAITSVYFSLFFVETDSITKVVIFIISAGFILQSVDVIDYYYQSQVLSKYVVISRNSAFILSSSLKIYLILSKFSVLYFAMAGVVDLALAGIFLLVIYNSIGGKILDWKFSKKLAIRLMRFSWPLALSVFLISIHLKVDQIMIGNMISVEQVGIYSVAVKLAEAWLFIPIIIVSTLMPYFINLRETNHDLYNYRLMQLYSLMFWMGVFVGVLITIFGKDLIEILFGKAYVEAYAALVFNIWAGIFTAQSGAKGIWVISENKQIYRVVLNTIAVIINISLNVILIPIYGINGAAISTLLTRFLNNWVAPLFIKAYRKNTWVSIQSVNPWYVYRNRCF